MDQDNLENLKTINVTRKTEPSFQGIYQEMRSLGLDPQPILEIAANDIYARHGTKALTYTGMILEGMQLEENADGIFLWTALHNIINKNHSTVKGEIRIH